jgi:hypothetical protein
MPLAEYLGCRKRGGGLGICVKSGAFIGVSHTWRAVRHGAGLSEFDCGERTFKKWGESVKTVVPKDGGKLQPWKLLGTGRAALYNKRCQLFFYVFEIGL